MRTAVAPAGTPIPWWKEPTKDQWYAWVASWLGWTLDAFDFTMFLLIMVPISQEFGVPLTEVAFLLSVTLWLRLRRRGRLGVARRPDRPQDAADDLDPVVFDLQLHRRLLADIWVSLSVSRAARHRHGRRMAGRRGARDGVLAGALPRVHERDAAGLVEPRVPFGQPDLWAGVQRNRLARVADDRGPSGPFGRLCALFRQGAAGLAGKPPAPARRRSARCTRRCSTSSSPACSATH